MVGFKSPRTGPKPTLTPLSVNEMADLWLTLDLNLLKKATGETIAQMKAVYETTR